MDPSFFFYIIHLSNKNITGLNTDYLLREWKGATLTAKQDQEAKPNTIILIYPIRADLGFSYYYDRSLYKSGNNYNQDLGKHNVYRIWSSDSLVQISDRHQGNDIVYYCDESAKVDSTTDGIYRMLLQRGYVNDSTIVFPLCTSVIKLHKTITN
jgi:hypothetical protein